MKNFSIKKKMIAIFGMLGALFVVTVIVSIVGLNYGGSQFQDFYEYSYPLSNKTLDIRRGIQTSIKALGLSMLTEDEEKSAAYIEEVETQMAGVSDNLNYLLENFRGDKSRLEEALNTLTKAKEYRMQIQELSLANQNSEASALFFDQYNPLVLEVRDLMASMDENTTALADSTYGAANKAQSFIQIAAIVISLVTLGAMVYLALYLTKSMTTPIFEIEAAAKQMAQGDFEHISIAYESKDELGSLADNMRLTTTRIGDYMTKITDGLAQLSDLDLNVAKQDEFLGIFKIVQDSVRKLIVSLNDSITQIAQSAEQVNAGSGQMAENAQSLAEGATEQAGAIEELTATVENVNTMAKESAEKAKDASLKTQQAVVNAQEGKQSMGELVTAMENINNVSMDIQNIIGTIEDIASQTNLLSLNASIEAARAGEAGRGFAVVADQIGKLAADSAKSAVETRELIGKSIQEVESGNTITQKTVSALEDIIRSMNEFAVMAGETSESSSSQAAMLAQVQEGIEQIAQVVQSNSASAEETSATSEELSAQADSLNSIVGQFKLKA